MRQLSTPGRRTAVWIAASLAVLASAGCMSVSDDESRKPAVSTSADGDGAVAEPDGGHLPPGGHGRHGAGGDSTGRDAKNGSASPSPSGSASAEPEPTRPGRQPPASEPAAPTGGASPSASRSSVPPPAQESPEPPVDSPPPSEPEPSDPPSASSAPEVHIGAMREVDHPSGARAEPAASPQSQPGAADGTRGTDGGADEREADGAGRPSAA
ncbi:hypothetical protein [Streptomyces sp. NPDC006274]|uniref:hypothetical protein n=1 Tax=unclassified Streptomyces TaxID=2593676 RepID=UPI0033AB481E